MLLRYVDGDKVNKLFEEFHDGGGNFSPKTTTYKIMRAGYPNLFKDAHAWVRKCKRFALFAGKERLVALPLWPILVNQPLMRWSIDFVGTINPNSSAGHKWILIAIYYFTCWMGAVALKEANENFVLNFYDELATKFGFPEFVISDKALAFVGARVVEWALRNAVYLNTLSNYYPQGNGLAESTNKNLLRIIKMTLEETSMIGIPS